MYIEKWKLSSLEAALLLDKAGTYLHEHAQYSDAGPLYQHSLSIREQLLGSNHPDTAISLNNLAKLYEVQGRYAEAEPLYQRAIAIFERMRSSGGSEHPDSTRVRENYESFLRNKKQS